MDHGRHISRLTGQRHSNINLIIKRTVLMRGRRINRIVEENVMSSAKGVGRRGLIPPSDGIRHGSRHNLDASEY